MNKIHEHILDTFVTERNPEWLEYLGAIEDHYTVENIIQVGCCSGAYMPAVTYYQALGLYNSDYGDEVQEVAMEFLAEIDSYEGLIEAMQHGKANLAAFLASTAVESWVSSLYSELEDMKEELENETYTYTVEVITTNLGTHEFELDLNESDDFEVLVLDTLTEIHDEKPVIESILVDGFELETTYLNMIVDEIRGE